MVVLCHRLVSNEWWRIADVIAPTYDNDYYDYVVVTDAAYAGWGAYVKCKADGRCDGLPAEMGTRRNRGESRVST